MAVLRFVTLIRNTAWAVIAGLSLVLAGGCEEDKAAEPQVSVVPSSTGFVDELALHDGNPCPMKLPTGDDPGGYGFGTNEPATAAPALAVPDEGWVCLYDPTEGPRQSTGDAFYKWVLEGGPHPTQDSQLADLITKVDLLVPPVRPEYCTADLGPRWMLVLSTQGDLTGAVVDDYGCNDVRLTDEPFETAPGEAEPLGTVPGVLHVPSGDLLRALKTAYDR